MMKWGRLLYVLYIVLWTCFLVIYLWALAKVLYYGLGIILPVLETTARVFRSFQSLFGLVSFLLWYLVCWTGYVVGFIVLVALGIWSDMNRMS
ncbi:hypothetical protein SMAC4_13345 [Sordaria macrospora]|uniref:uncharacterized protein n=1 Tax=Sordaria macrospora TaxID=5147 RepID=UPI002B2FCAC4|nr:hypothetical protein SMAC4_13345 [Sordaria macrospora]